MPARLTYSPKAFVYTKNQAGTVYNLTNYVTQGEVQRKVDQVSSAEVTLRNPYKLFTGGLGQPRAFHPMDPITIYLERLQGFPVRVFTGYLDTTPYYQMYPGTITLKASCTLKRLLYSYFDPSLPYIIAFFEKYGWINTGQGSIISSSAFGNQGATQAQVNAGAKPFTDLQDGSLAKLLWAILFDIGEWDDSNIYIENLPTGADGIASRMEALMQSLQASQTQAVSDFTSFLTNIIGASAQGSGGGAGAISGSGGGTSSGPVKGGKAIVETTQPIANKYGVPLEMVLAVMDVETSFNNTDSNPKYTGWFQCQNSGDGGSPPYAYGPWSTHVPTVAETHDLGSSCNAFCAAAAGWASHQPSLRNDIHQWAEVTQGVAQSIAAGGNQRYVTFWSQALTDAQSLISQFGNTNAAGNASVPGPTSSQAGATAPTASPITSNSGYVNPFAKATNTVGERYDRGVDYHCDPGSAIVALGDCVFDGLDPSWYAGQPLLAFTLTSGPLKGCRYYYAEGIGQPTYPKGTTFKAGQTVATTTSQPSGLEFGWASNTPGSTATYSQSQESPNPDTDAVSINAAHMWERLMRIVGAPHSSGGDPGTGAVAPNGNNGKGIIVSTAVGGSGTSTTGSVSGTGTAQAFVAELQFPSVEDQVTAIALGAEHKGLMHDQALMPFVQQVAQASLRSFQSLPDGTFYAFYPDYFGEMGHHKPYWYIRDIEILDGGINLSDDALATHVFAVGDNTWPVNNELLNMLFSAGAINIFNAFVDTGIINATSRNSTTSNKKKSSKTSKPKTRKVGGLDPGIMNAEEAVQFIKRYGARPLVQNYPMVRSPIFEMLLAYQQFMLAWSNQFKTPFTFTFMPELFPGGKVGFPDHGLQMYVNSVTHSWNLDEAGFTTTAELSAPALMQGVTASDFPDLPPNMVQAMIEPVKQTNTKDNSQATAQSLQNVYNIVEQGIANIAGSLGGIVGEPVSNAGHGTVA